MSFLNICPFFFSDLHCIIIKMQIFLILLIFNINLLHQFVRTETKVKKFLLVGEDGKKVMLMKAIAGKSLTEPGDNQIYQAKPLEWPHMQRQCGMLKYNEVAVKIVHLMKRKKFEMLTHEVDMLWLAKANACQRVVQLFEAHIAKNTVYMVMELGKQTLEKRIENFREKWKEKEGKAQMMMDIHEIIMDMAKALTDFHRIGIHFALKSSNWLYFKDGVKLIDLQTTLPVDGNGKSIEIDKNWIYICKGLDKKTSHHEALGQNHASPEHKKFCRAITKDEKNIDPNGLSTASDIWSFGVVICEILLATPQIQLLISQKKWPNEWQTPRKLLYLHGIISTSIMYIDNAEEWNDPKQQKEAKMVKEEFMAIIEEEFPHIYVLLENSIFLLNPEDRANANEIQKYLEENYKIHEKEGKWPGKDEAKRILKGKKENATVSVEWAKNAEFVIEEEKEEEGQKNANELMPKGQSSTHLRQNPHNSSERTP